MLEAMPPLSKQYNFQSGLVRLDTKSVLFAQVVLSTFK